MALLECDHAHERGHDTLRAGWIKLITHELPVIADLLGKHHSVAGVLSAKGGMIEQV